MAIQTPPKSKTIGKIGEKIAQKFLQKKGYEIICKNFHIFGGEIDLIAKKDDILIFVEVKTRSSEAFGGGELALTRQKKHKLLRTIFHYLSKTPITTWRLDLISVQIDQWQNTARLKHFSDVFTL